MSCRPPPLQEARCAARQGASANREDDLGSCRLVPNERKGLFVLHERVHSISSGHEQNVKLGRLRKTQCRCEDQPAKISRRLCGFPDDVK